MSQKKTPDSLPEDDAVFEGGTGGDQKTNTDDARKAFENPAAYEGLRSMIINPDDDEDENNEREKENPAETGGE